MGLWALKKPLGADNPLGLWVLKNSGCRQWVPTTGATNGFECFLLYFRGLYYSKYFIDDYCKENELPKMSLAPKTQSKLLKYPWPGNIRELKAVLELACVMADTNVITSEHILFNSTGSIDTLLQNEMALEEYKNKIIKHFLDKYNNDVVTVANKLDIGKSTIYRMLQEKVI